MWCLLSYYLMILTSAELNEQTLLSHTTEMSSETECCCLFPPTWSSYFFSASQWTLQENAEHKIGMMVSDTLLTFVNGHIYWTVSFILYLIYKTFWKLAVVLESATKWSLFCWVCQIELCIYTYLCIYICI